MALRFPIGAAFTGRENPVPVKRPKEFACFSYDANHEYHLGDSSLKWYYPPDLGTSLSKGLDSFVKHDDTVDEHLDTLLRTIMSHEQATGEPIDAHIVTWRGMLTKIMAAPFDDSPFEMSVTRYRCQSFIEEHRAFKIQQEQQSTARQPRGRHGIPNSEMHRTNISAGYKFETLSTLPRPWGETSREYIENRDNEIVNNKEQYCSVVRTGFGNTIVCLGGEVDAIWDAKPPTPGDPINWVELKTSAEIHSHQDRVRFDRKLMKYWIQSFLLGVPQIIVGFRSESGVLRSVETLETRKIPHQVQSRELARWDGNVCIKFASLFLEWLRVSVPDEGVWRIKRGKGWNDIELSEVEEAGHGSIITDEFMNWRIKLALSKEKPPDEAPPPILEQASPPGV
ncbi:RAI1 like PD-XK nuclease-domain-containing protein [Staphylotrichum tortipilum]|uniref:Decapping nuclease n=1 Tax=Staphylotrichum tortipilum TaxID=2831512 RepID=A0AAN6RY32_9PEZI|nr:RAI1 like PD-XK nuclease-domain-containing protein [Staphylotrichum longicolle]